MVVRGARNSHLRGSRGPVQGALLGNPLWNNMYGVLNETEIDSNAHRSGAPT